MIAKSIFLLLILSLEATIGVPFFFLYLVWLWFDQWSLPRGVAVQFISGLFLALFYDVSWPLLATILLGAYLLKKQMSRVDQWFLFWLLYLVVMGLLAYIAQINWQVLSGLHGLVFIAYVWLIRHFRHRSSLSGKGLVR